MSKNCPSCGAKNEHITKSLQNDMFVYGTNNSTTLNCVIPTFYCNNCKFQWTDSEAEMIRHTTKQNFINRKNNNV